MCLHEVQTADLHSWRSMFDLRAYMGFSASAAQCVTARLLNRVPTSDLPPVAGQKFHQCTVKSAAGQRRYICGQWQGCGAQHVLNLLLLNRRFISVQPNPQQDSTDKLPKPDERALVQSGC